MPVGVQPYLIEDVQMSSVLRPALSLIVLMSLITGVAYPLLVTGVAQVAFPAQANGSLLYDETGKVRGSTLIAQSFSGDEWLQSRPPRGAHRGQWREQLRTEQPGAGEPASRRMPPGWRTPRKGPCHWPC